MTRKQIRAEAARYAKFVEWSDEDQCFIGRCPELMLGGVHGDEEAKVYAELCVAAEEMVALIRADGQELPEPLGAKKFSDSLGFAAGFARRGAPKAPARPAGRRPYR